MHSRKTGKKRQTECITLLMVEDLKVQTKTSLTFHSMAWLQGLGLGLWSRVSVSVSLE